MKTKRDWMACAAMRHPSTRRCGTRSMISRSLNVPGSDSSALTVMYTGFAILSGVGMKLALRPVGKNAPPRPRRFDSIRSEMTSCGGIARAFASCAYPPTAWYDVMSRSGCSTAPPRASAGSALAAIAQLLHDRWNVVRRDRLLVPVVDRDRGRRRARAETLDGAQ